MSQGATDGASIGGQRSYKYESDSAVSNMGWCCWPWSPELQRAVAVAAKGGRRRCEHRTVELRRMDYQSIMLARRSAVLLHAVREDSDVKKGPPTCKRTERKRREF